MKNYMRENIERYRRMAGTGVPAGYDEFSSRGFLDEVIPRLARHRERPRVLELGTGIGPGAVYLAERGCAVHAVDVIPEAIARARRIAAERGIGAMRRGVYERRGAVGHRLTSGAFDEQVPARAQVRGRRPTSV